MKDDGIKQLFIHLFIRSFVHAFIHAAFTRAGQSLARAVRDRLLSKCRSNCGVAAKDALAAAAANNLPAAIWLGDKNGGNWHVA